MMGVFNWDLTPAPVPDSGESAVRAEASAEAGVGLVPGAPPEA